MSTKTKQLMVAEMSAAEEWAAGGGGGGGSSLMNKIIICTLPQPFHIFCFPQKSLVNFPFD